MWLLCYKWGMGIKWDSTCEPASPTPSTDSMSSTGKIWKGWFLPFTVFGGASKRNRATWALREWISGLGELRQVGNAEFCSCQWHSLDPILIWDAVLEWRELGSLPVEDIQGGDKKVGKCQSLGISRMHGGQDVLCAEFSGLFMHRSHTSPQGAV